MREVRRFCKRGTGEVSYSVEKDYVDDWKSTLAEIKGEDIDITPDSVNDEDKGEWKERKLVVNVF